jgi:hypothetical protein
MTRFSGWETGESCTLGAPRAKFNRGCPPRDSPIGGIAYDKRSCGRHRDSARYLSPNCCLTGAARLESLRPRGPATPTAETSTLITGGLCATRPRMSA